MPISVLLIAAARGASASSSAGPAFGRRILAVGGNRTRRRWPAFRSSGHSSPYTFVGVLAATAGVLSTAGQGASDPSFVGLLIELSAITAVVVGGTPLSGGRSASSAR